MKTIGQRFRHLRRYQEVAQILIRHGFGEVVEQLGLAQYLELPRRFLRRGPAAELTGLTAPQRVRRAVEELGPAYIKLAQVLSTRPDLIPPPYLAELAHLQDRVPAASWPTIRTRIQEELGAPPEELFADLEIEPVAAASLAQVHQATLHSGEKVVVKVQRPDIETVIETDLEILFDLARFLHARTPLGKVYDLPEIAEDFAYTLRAEMDYRREGRNADRFRRNFDGESYLHIPRVYWDLTTQRVIVFERIAGIKINDVDALDAAGLDRRQIARHCARLIVKEVLEDGFFHADPHPGNFFVMRDAGGEPVIGAMDFGLVGHLAPRVKEDLVRLFIVAAQLDAESIVEQLVRMSAAERRADRAGLQRDLERLLNRYHGRPLADIRAREVVEEVMPVAFRHQLRLPSELWLLGKTLVMMEGVGITLDPDLDMFEVAEPYARRFLRGLISPQVWGRKLLKGAEGWSDLMLRLPVQLPRLMDQVADLEFFRVALTWRGRSKKISKCIKKSQRISKSGRT